MAARSVHPPVPTANVMVFRAHHTRQPDSGIGERDRGGYRSGAVSRRDAQRVEEGRGHPCCVDQRHTQPIGLISPGGDQLAAFTSRVVVMREVHRLAPLRKSGRPGPVGRVGVRVAARGACGQHR